MSEPEQYAVPIEEQPNRKRLDSRWEMVELSEKLPTIAEFVKDSELLHEFENVLIPAVEERLGFCAANVVKARRIVSDSGEALMKATKNPNTEGSTPRDISMLLFLASELDEELQQRSPSQAAIVRLLITELEGKHTDGS